MQVLKRGVKVQDKTVYNLQAIFACLLIVGQRRNLEFSAVVQHELCTVPLSIIDEYGCLRKGNKSVLVKHLAIIIKNPPPPDILLVDASQLLYHIVWPSSGTVSDLANGMKSHLPNYRGVETYVIFDQYDGISAKDHERHRRAGEGLSGYQLTLNSPLAGRDAIMKNKDNKRQLSQLLCTHDLGNNIELVSRAGSIVQHKEADISLISYMLHRQELGLCTSSVMTQMCLCRLCTGAGKLACHAMYRWRSGIGQCSTSMQLLPSSGRNARVSWECMHSQDVTLSYPNGKGKMSALKVLNQTDIDGIDSVLGEVNATQSDLIATGTAFFLALYCQKKSTSMNAARYEIYHK
jgi:hypothetical protein